MVWTVSERCSSVDCMVFGLEAGRNAAAYLKAQGN